MNGIFTLKLGKPGWTEQSKVVSECILKCNFFMQTDVLHKLISGYLSYCFTYAIRAFKVKTHRYSLIPPVPILLSDICGCLSEDCNFVSTLLFARDSIYAIVRIMLSPVCPSVCHTGGSVKNG